MEKECISKCWYNAVCQHPQRIACGEDKDCTYTHMCPRFLEMKYLMEHSGIPVSKQKSIMLNPQEVDYNAFCMLADIKDDIVNFVKNGKNLYICSQFPGNGKTSWSLKLMMRFFNEIWLGNGFRTRGIFVHVPTFLLKYKNFDVKDSEFEILKEELPKVDLVIWDDIACTTVSNYDLSLLTMYIDQRILSDKSNIFTGNIVDVNSIESILGARLKSRIWSTSQHIEFKGNDRREK